MVVWFSGENSIKASSTDGGTMRRTATVEEARKRSYVTGCLPGTHQRTPCQEYAGMSLSDSRASAAGGDSHHRRNKHPSL